MIYQQINLYRGVFDVRPDLSFYKILQIWGIFFMALFVYYGVMVSFGMSDMHHLKSMNNQKNAINKEIERKKVFLNTLDQRESLKKEIEDLLKKKEERQKVLILLQDQGLDKKINLSGFLESLSNAHVPGAWYTEIIIQHNGGDIQLSGQAKSANLVPLLIKSIQKETIYDGKVFSDLTIDQIEKNKKPVKFFAKTAGVKKS